jgi:hypothetical protein
MDRKRQDVINPSSVEFSGFSRLDNHDGVNIATIRTLRSRITTVSHDMLDLPSSVRDNLTPNDMNKAREDRVDEDAKLLGALDQVGLKSTSTQTAAWTRSWTRYGYQRIGSRFLH